MFQKNVVKQLTEYFSKYLSWYFLTLRYFLRRPRCTKASPLWPSLGQSSPFSPLLPSWTCLQVSWQLFWLEILAWLWLRFWKTWVSWERLSGRQEPHCTGWCQSRLDRSSNKIQPVPKKWSVLTFRPGNSTCRRFLEGFHSSFRGVQNPKLKIKYHLPSKLIKN